MVTSAVLLADKPGGITSHQVVSRARRALGTKKVGHAGTLDPMATGLMILGIEKGTRLLGHLTGMDKTYEATIRLGVSTTTDDAEGEVATARGARLEDLGSRLAAGVAALTGPLSQVPSSVSAIKVNGQRAYAMVRRGEEVALAARPVVVSRFDVLDVRSGESDEGQAVVDLDVVVDCSSGTYIRALARDLGEGLGVGGHLTALRRTRIGPFQLAHAGWDATLPELARGELFPLPTYPLADVAPVLFATVEASDEQARDIGFGRPLSQPVPANPTAMLHGGHLLALYRPEGSGSVPVAVLV